MDMEHKMSIIPSIWVSIYNWLTPTVLFLVLNLTIGVIALTSNLPPKKKSDHRRNHLRLVGKSPILIHTLNSADPNPPTPSDSIHADVNPSQTTTQFDLPHQNGKLPRETETRFVETEQNLEEIHASSRETEQTGDTDGGKEEREAPEKDLSKTAEEIFNRMKKESELSGKPPARPRKPGEAKSGLAQVEENDVVTEDEEEDEGVDAKADDFINKFKEQLKLQRIESWRKSKGWMIDEGM